MDKVNKHHNKNIGIIIESLENSQLAYESIYSINKEINQNSPLDYRIFFENFNHSVLNPLCAIMNINEIWHYNGLLITTSLANTRLALKLVGPVRIAFYIWDIEFLRQKNNYFENIEVYRHPKIKLVARSNAHSKAIENYCNRRPDLIMENIALAELNKII